MARHSDLYRLIEPVPDLRSEDGRGPVLVHGLEGFSDAGLAIQGVSEHLRESLDSQLIVEFDVDELVDYRSRRPHLKYSFDRFADYNEPTIQMHAVKASDGTSFLLLSGLEPDLKWDGFTESVIDLAGSFGVRMSIGLGAMPLGVPHTRPTNSSAHASDVDLIKGFSAWPGEFSVPGNVTSLLELRMAEHGIPSAGFTVHVPQYLSQTAYPAAVLHLVGSIAEIADLELPTAELEKAAEEFTAQVNAQIAQSPEILTAVELMEKQYDEFMETRLGSDSLNPGGKPLPSGDEIGAEFERFLAQQTGDGGQGDDPQRDG
ncbi:proteasome assembly chaperone family protein [Dietzia cinnamea]|uniref:Proteasome assembly chaperone family protein n=1 Tax=Dietzia cinnamea TaxID=321318 RepID=A0ABV3YNI6_9ACTN|nr:MULTISPECIES: PAC2 family protein [Dietzia]KZO60150.1 proteasome protein [Dietzia maris]AVM65176.1 PAC2 family protein [Dietzia sp. oral taxon 368]MCT1713383.1 PAC2 family protein [Dietzia cinnamea]MCT2057422.1 PAC2 family protein [Dietzia cinnamea]MCT2098364.1 PAC2 family protein [Dietzia cinnamea]